MKYPPSHHQEKNFQNIIQVIKCYPLALLITSKNDEVLTTHLPLIYQENNSLGKLTGHIDKYNPQAPLLKDNFNVHIVFNGPDSYISPASYKGKKLLPTWNYIKVHLQGKVRQIEDKEVIKSSIVSMTEFLEAPDHNFKLDHHDPRMEQLVDYISGFEIEITHWEGKFKLSQDKSENDMMAAKRTLIEKQQNPIEDFLNTILKNHQQ